MTVPNINDRDSYVGNGAQTVFAFNYRTTETSQVEVYLDGALQVSGYTVKRDVSGIGGTVTFTVAPANGKVVLLFRNSDYLQGDDLGGNDTLPPDTIERMIDKAFIIGQQLLSKIASCLKLPVTIDPETFSTDLNDPTALNFLRVNAEADGFEFVSIEQAVNEAVTIGTGNVIGPASSNNGGVALYNGTDGKTIKNGPAPGAAGNLLTSDGAGNWTSAAPPVVAPDVVPSGAVWFFPDPDFIPAGWEEMKGQEVTINGSPYTTPDCRGKYILAATEDDSGSAGHTGSSVRPGVVGGALTHNHTQSGTFATNTLNPGGAVTAGTGAQTAKATDISHAHNVTISGNTGNNSNRPISVGLIACIKVDE